MNKKYKLIKEYPDSPDLGYEITFKEGYPYINCHEGKFSLEMCDKHPDFWEEVKELDFEILELSDGYNKYYKCEDGMFTINLQHKYELEHLLSGKSYSITKIKRLSDCEIFTIGDICDGEAVTKTEIISFEISNSKLLINISSGHIKLHDIKHFKTVLFTTEDGVDKFRGDSYYFIVVNENNPTHLILNSHIVDWDNPKKPPLGHVQFNYKLKAQDYINDNKIVYSKQQILDALTGEWNHRDVIKNKLGI